MAKNHLEITSILDNILHIFDCWQYDPYVSQETWTLN